jgi:hypothetical protein
VPSAPVVTLVENPFVLIVNTAPASVACVARSTFVTRIAPRTGVTLDGTGVTVGGTGALVAVGVGVSVGGTGVFVGVSEGGTGVFVGVGVGVSVGGTGVFVGVSEGGTGVLVPVGVGVSEGGTGVFVPVGVWVAVGVSVSSAHVAAIDCVVPPGLVTVAVMVEPGGPLMPRLLTPVRENGAPVGPPGVMV